MKGKRIDNIDENQVRYLYFERGCSLRELGRAINVSPATVSRTLKRLGIRARTKAEQKRYRNALILDRIGADKWYAKGTSMEDLVKWSGLDQFSIRVYLLDRGLSIRPPAEAMRLFAEKRRQAREERIASKTTEKTLYFPSGKQLVVTYNTDGEEIEKCEIDTR